MPLYTFSSAAASPSLAVLGFITTTPAAIRHGCRGVIAHAELDELLHARVAAFFLAASTASGLMSVAMIRPSQNLLTVCAPAHEAPARALHRTRRDA